MNILWFLIGIAAIGAVWAVADALYSRRRRALVDEPLFERYLHAFEQALGSRSAPVAVVGRLRREARLHWNVLRQVTRTGHRAELLAHLRGVNRTIVEHLPANARGAVAAEVAARTGRLVGAGLPRGHDARGG